MPYATEITWDDLAYSNLRNDLARSETHHAHYHQQQARLSEEISDLRKWATAIAETLGTLVPTDTTHGAALHCQLLRTLDSMQQGTLDALTAEQSQLAATTQQITRTREQLRRYPSSYDGRKKATKKDIATALKGLPNLKPGSIATGYTATQEPFARWIFTGILMQPNYNPFSWLRGLGPGNTPSIPLPDIEAHLNCATGRVSLRPLRGQRDSAPFFWSPTSTIHPHVLNDDYPCMGDFAGPFREAVDEMDWVSAYTFLRLFLSRAIDDDSAGRHWRDLFTATIHAQQGWADSCAAMAGDSHYLFIVEQSPGNFELQSRDGNDLLLSKTLTTTPLERVGRRFEPVNRG